VDEEHLIHGVHGTRSELETPKDPRDHGHSDPVVRGRDQVIGRRFACEQEAPKGGHFVIGL